MLKKFVTIILDIPKEVRIFLIKALIFFLAWKLIYHFYFWPNSTLDEPLTKLTTATTAGVLNFFYADAPISWVGMKMAIAEQGYYAAILLNGKKIIGIAEACNALELMVLYAALIVCLKTNFKRMIAFIAGGCIIIFTLNVLRCLAMFKLALNKSVFFEFAHHYGFTLTVYVCIFLLWMWYAKALSINSTKN